MSTLTKIQKVMRVLRIIAQIVMVFAYVGGGLLLVAGVACLCAKNLTMAEWLQRHLVNVGDYSHWQVGLASLAGAVALFANGVMFTFAVRYLNTELKDGTPFTLAGATRVRHLGIISIVVALVASVMNSWLTGFIDHNLLYSFETVNGLFLGVVLLLASLIFQHGAELQQATPANPDAK